MMEDAELRRKIKQLRKEGHTQDGMAKVLKISREKVKTHLYRIDAEAKRYSIVKAKRECQIAESSIFTTRTEQSKRMFDLEPVDCKWPVSSRNDWFCAKEACLPYPYCKDHIDKAYQNFSWIKYAQNHGSD